MSFFMSLNMKNMSSSLIVIAVKSLFFLTAISLFLLSQPFLTSAQQQQQPQEIFNRPNANSISNQVVPPFFPSSSNNNINSGSAQAQVILNSGNDNSNQGSSGSSNNRQQSGWIPVRCNREPLGVTSKKTPGDNGFKIKISGNPEKYTPGEVYTVSLTGYKTLYTIQKFIGFTLVVEPRDWSLNEESGSSSQLSASPPYSSPSTLFGGSTPSPVTPPEVGLFQLYGDALTKISEDCPNGIVHTSTIPKSEIQVMWQTPPPGSGCVVFRATVIEHRETWYMDDGGLTRVLCEEETESSDDQPDILDECCACDEAKYEVIFEGIWSKYTHPKEFPANFWLTHFSDIIGASHSSDFRMWEYGGYASEGLQQVAELGVTKKLEAELKAESNKIRTIIKARGLWYPNLNGKTFAVFRADRKHHLMSLVSMLGPSPDWIVGVSALELCLKNCSWASEKQINLYLWDAGTDSGLSYLSPNTPTEPKERIRKITPSNPNNAESPFFDTTGSRMKPFAKLTVTRQRMYEKPCDEENDVGVNRNPAEAVDSEDSRDECKVTEWTDWSACSASCGQGVRIRTRNYLVVGKARSAQCSVTLIEKDSCDVDCVGDVSCATTPWTEWSECSVTCGKGYRTRTRLFANRAARKICSQVDLVDTDPCFGVMSECTDTNLDQIDPKCMVTEWSEWSPCTSSCGPGIKARTRLYINSGVSSLCDVKLIDKSPCFGERSGSNDCPPSSSNGPQSSFYGGIGNNNNYVNNSIPSFGPQESKDYFNFRNPSGRGGSLSSSNGSDGQPVDCVHTPWGPWTECNKTCGKAHKTRRRMIKQYPMNGGRECPGKTVQRRRCKENPPCTRKHSYPTSSEPLS